MSEERVSPRQKKRKREAPDDASSSRKAKKMPTAEQLRRRQQMCDLLWTHGIPFKVEMQSLTMEIDPAMMRITTARRYADASTCQMMMHAGIRGARSVRVRTTNNTNVVHALARKLVEKWRRVAPRKSGSAFLKQELKSLDLANDLSLLNAFHAAAQEMQVDEAESK